MEDLECPQAGGLRDILIPPYLLLQHFLVATPLWRCQRVNTISTGSAWVLTAQTVSLGRWRVLATTTFTFLVKLRREEKQENSYTLLLLVLNPIMILDDSSYLYLNLILFVYDFVFDTTTMISIVAAAINNQ
jgi:hypothetical protein